MVVAVVRGERFTWDGPGYRAPAHVRTSSYRRSEKALADVARFFGLRNTNQYCHTLEAEGRGILRRLPAKVRRKFGVTL